MGSAFDHLGRFARPAQQILNVLAAGPRVPHVIQREVDARCGLNLGPGTLFGAIARLERRGLIEVIAGPAAPRAYRLTALGAEALEAQLAASARLAPMSAPVANRSPARIDRVEGPWLIILVGPAPILLAWSALTRNTPTIGAA